MPRTECLKDVIARFLPYWEAEIVPDLREGKVVLVAAHGNSLRALVKHLDGISDEDIAALNIPTGMPLVYELDEDMRPTVVGGRYLDPRRRCAAAAVANQGVAAGSPAGLAATRVADEPSARGSAGSPVTTNTTRLATETAWSAMRS